jgi:predicted PurR-regulated permease PerM
MDYQAVQRAWFLILLGVVTVAFLWLTLDFIQPVFWAAVLATIFDPLQKQIESRLAGRKSLAALLSLLIIVVVVFLPLVLLGVAVSQEALNLYNRIQNNNVDLQTFVTRIDPAVRDAAARIGIDPGSIEQRIYQGAGAAAQLIATRAVVVGQNLLAVVAKTALMLYLLFFFLRDGERLLVALADAIPLGAGRQRTLFHRFAGVTRATL